MSNTRIKTKARERRQRRQERPVSVAALWSIFAVFATAAVIAWVEASTPASSLRDFWKLVVDNGQVSPMSPIYQRLYNDLLRQEILVVTPICLLIGGIAFGRLCPRHIPRARALGFATAVAAAVILACILFYWGLILSIQHGHLTAGEIDLELIVTQTIATIAWIAVYIVGVWSGLYWRDARLKIPAVPSETV